MKIRYWLAAALCSRLRARAGRGAAPVDRPARHGRPRRRRHAHFPEQVGEFRRGRVIQYDAAGANLSASYELVRPEGRMLLTVYVYPAAAVTAAPGSGQTADVARATLCRQELSRSARRSRTSRNIAARAGSRKVARPVSRESPPRSACARSTASPPPCSARASRRSARRPSSIAMSAAVAGEVSRLGRPGASTRARRSRPSSATAPGRAASRRRRRPTRRCCGRARRTRRLC